MSELSLSFTPASGEDDDVWETLRRAGQLAGEDGAEQAEALLDGLIGRLSGDASFAVQTRVTEALALRYLLLLSTERALECEAAARALADRSVEVVPSGVRSVVLDALERLVVHGVRRDRRDADRFWGGLVARLGWVSDDPSLFGQCLGAIRRRVDALDALGDSSGAEGAFDAVLLQLETAPVPAVVTLRLTVLTLKAKWLEAQARAAEAVVVLESVIAGCEATPESTGRETTALRLGALVLMGECFASFGDIGALAVLPERLAEALGDVTHPPDNTDESVVDELPEREIASLLATLLSEEFWAPIEVSVQNGDLRPQLAQTAVSLYLKIRPWTVPVSRHEERELPAVSAVTIIQRIVDTCAVHSQPLDPEDHSVVPSREKIAEGARIIGLDEWAASCGHPLPGTGKDPELEWPPTSPPPDPNQEEGTLPLGDFAELLCRYQMYRLMYDSETGRQLVNRDARQRKARAVARLLATLELTIQTFREVPDAIGVAVVWLRIAEALFVSAHTQPNSSAEMLISPHEIRWILEETDADAWLQDHGFLLPPWLEATAN